MKTDMFLRGLFAISLGAMWANPVEAAPPVKSSGSIVVPKVSPRSPGFRVGPHVFPGSGSIAPPAPVVPVRPHEYCPPGSPFGFVKSRRLERLEEERLRLENERVRKEIRELDALAKERKEAEKKAQLRVQEKVEAEKRAKVEAYEKAKKAREAEILQKAKRAQSVIDAFIAQRLSSPEKP